MHQNHILDCHCCSPFFLSVFFKCINPSKPTPFVRDKPPYNPSGWSFAWLLLQHPFPDVWRTVQDRDPCQLTHVEKTDSVDIHEINLAQIQGYSGSATTHLSLNLANVLGSKLSAQTNARLALSSNPLDLQRHGSVP